MKRKRDLFAAVLLCVASCTASGSGGGGGFRLLEFTDAGKDSIARNHELTFLFSQPVLGTAQQNFPERLKIENVDTGGGGSNFALAVGVYLVDGDVVHFYPRLPDEMDRSDAGFRADGSYHVFLKGGPDAFQSASGAAVSNPQDFLFATSRYFEDPVPSSPPRALALMAVDPTTEVATDISRLDPTPAVLAALDSKTLLDGGRIVDPGAGGPPQYFTPWHFDLTVSEPLDPDTIVPSNVEMLEIRDDALDDNNQAAPGDFGVQVSYRVPLDVSVVQGYDASGNLSVVIRAVPLQTLVDDARYRITFSGSILGIDYRRSFVGDNGLTGDGLAVGEPGGLGYTSEFLVYDRPAIAGERVLTYDPLVDGIEPETGQTVLPGDTADLNTALYNPGSDPGHAVGYLPAFGDGSDGNLSVPGGTVYTLDTGDMKNPDLGNPFTVQDLNPDDDYIGNPLPGGIKTYDSTQPYELRLASLTVSSSATLKVVGVNPLLLRVAGIVQITGTLDASGGNGQNGGSGLALGGTAGAGGFDGAEGKRGLSTTCYPSPYSTCMTFKSYLDACSSTAKAQFPFSRNGNGPGRGYAGGEMWGYYATDYLAYCTGTGGGGASHATSGQAGEDRLNLGAAPGTVGSACGPYLFSSHNSGVAGVRGQPGPTYGDPEVKNVTLGGSGGASGGASHIYYYNGNGSGGSGGGGGGSVTIVSSGDIVSNGGTLSVSGGNGGRGAVMVNYPYYNYGWYMATGGGGGGSGGSLVLVSGGNIQLTAAVLNATGGSGGARANQGSGISCSGCNAGGDGGNGYVLLMDADGQITGLLPGSSGSYPADGRGYLTIQPFDATRFSSIRSSTELFSVKAADPDYMNFTPADILANVAAGQSIVFKASSAQSDPENPLVPDLTTETPDVEVARAVFSAGASTITITGDLGDVNTAGRNAFVRIKADFDYTNGVEAAIGPYASVDRVTIHFTFNG